MFAFLLAEKYGLWKNIVFEYPKRIPYLDVLVHLNIADGIFILGSTEPHYTPSKTYQAVLSEKFILAVLHQESTAVEVVRNSKSGTVLDFDGELGVKKIATTFNNYFLEWKIVMNDFNPNNVEKLAFEKYSAKVITNSLVDLLNKVVAY